MLSSTCEEWTAALAALRASVSRVLELSADTLTIPETLDLAEQWEVQCRRMPVARHALINHLVAHATKAELGGTLRCVLADRWRVAKAEAGKHIAEAKELGPRRALTGQVLGPLLTATAAAQAAGWSVTGTSG